MKQKIIYVVFLMVAVYLPASSKECAKLQNCTVAEKILQLKQKVTVKIEEENVLVASPFRSLLLDL